MQGVTTTIAVLTTRLILGFIFLMQGFGKVFIWGVENVYSMKFFQETYKDLLSDYITYATAYYTSYVELIGGLLLVLGLKRDYALYALASVLVIVTFGHGLAEPIWDLPHVIYRAILLISLLIFPKEWDKFSIDNYIHKYTNAKKNKRYLNKLLFCPSIYIKNLLQSGSGVNGLSLLFQI